MIKTKFVLITWSLDLTDHFAMPEDIKERFFVSVLRKIEDKRKFVSSLNEVEEQKTKEIQHRRFKKTTGMNIGKPDWHDPN